MSNIIITKIKAFIADLEADLGPTATTIETDVEAAGTAALNYIKTNGLQDLYQIALTAVSAAIPGASWSGVLANIVSQATADGKTLLKGAEAIVAAQAQADLIAAGKLIAPATAAPVASAPLDSPPVDTPPAPATPAQAPLTPLQVAQARLQGVVNTSGS